MLKTRDFYLMKVYDIKGKYLGVVQDISIDFNNSKVMGFIISRVSFFSKKNYVPVEDVVSLLDIMIVRTLKEFSGLKFKEFKYIDIINENNVMEGVLEDLIIDKADYSIKALVVSSGIFDRLIKGKKIILPHCCVLCEEFILYRDNEVIRFTTLPHNIGGMKNVKKE